MAARELQTFLREHPEHPHARRASFLLGEALLQLGQYQDALARFTEYLHQEPQGPWAAKALFRSGESAFFADKKAEAVSFLKEFLGRYPTDPLGAYALSYLGQLARREKDWKTAANYFQQCLERFPQSPLQTECQLGLAQSWEALGQTEQAIAGYQAVAQRDSGPAGADAQFRWAVLLYNLQRYAEAAGAFELFERRFPGTIRVEYARLYRGFALFHLKKWEEARRSLESVAALPSSEGAIPGKLSGPTPSPQPSLIAPSGAGSEGPASSSGPDAERQRLRRQAQYWLGMIQREQGQWAAAAQTFAHLAQTASQPAEQVEFHFYAGDAWLRAQDAHAALKEFDLALPILGGPSRLEKTPSENASSRSPSTKPEGGPEAEQVHSWLDKILRGKVEAAVLVQNHALVDQTAGEFFQRCPQSPLAADVARWQAQSWIHRKQFQEAIRILEPWADKAPSAELAWHIKYLLACAYQAVGRRDQAQALLGPILQADSADWKSLGQLAQASIHIAQKEYAQAVPLLEAYLASGASEAHRATGQAQLAICYARLRQTDKAQAIYKTLAEQQATAPWLGAWTEQLADAALEAGDFAWATTLFGRLANQTTDASLTHRGLLGLGWTQYRAGQFPEASGTLARLLALNPPAPVAAEAAFLRGTILAQIRQPDAALALFQMVAEKYPETKWAGPAMLAAARLHAQLQQHAQAVPLFQRYVQTFPKADQQDTILYDWAWSLKELGQQEEALKLFERLYQEFPQSPYWAEAGLRLAQHAYQTQQYERAGQLVSAVLAGHPKADLRPYALYLHMQVFAAQDQWEKVSQTAQQLLQEHPDSPLRVYGEFWQVEVAFRKKDFDGALKRLEEFVQKHPSPPAGLAPLAALRRAQLLAHQRRWEEVLQAAEQLRQQYPDFDQLYEADYLLGRALASKARFDEARQAFQRVIRSPQGAKTETAAMAQWYIGETYFHQQDYQTALRAYLLVEILYGYPEWQALALLEAARCRQMLGQKTEAQQLYQRLLEQFPNTTAAQEYRKRQAGPSDGPPANPPAPASTPDAVPLKTPSRPTGQKTFRLQQNRPEEKSEEFPLAKGNGFHPPDADQTSLFGFHETPSWRKAVRSGVYGHLIRESLSPFSFFIRTC